MTFRMHRGTTPLLVSMPHVGTHLPDTLKPRLVERALAVEDTDWHLERLYDFVEALGASLIVPHESRIVIDLNRGSDNQPMYPGRNNTELCPTSFFTGDPIYREGCAPDEAEIRQRVAEHWQPYHEALGDELGRLRAQQPGFGIQRLLLGVQQIQRGARAKCGLFADRLEGGAGSGHLPLACHDAGARDLQLRPSLRHVTLVWQ